MMSESMVERVARILEPQAWRALGLADTLAYASRRTSSLRKARAAIEAMRDPTDSMVDAALCATGFYEDGTNDYLVYYTAMIDGALKGERNAST